MAEGYGKRPLWQWIIIYLVIAGVVYTVIYYFFLAPKRQSQVPTTGQPTTAQPTASSPFGY